MRNNSKKNSSFVRSLCIFSALIFFRIMLSNYEDISIGMSIFNFVALDYVILDIFSEGFFAFKKGMVKTYLPAAVIRRKVCLIRILLALALILLLATEGLYTLFGQNQMLDDILTMLALFLSIENDVIANGVVLIISKIVKVRKEN